MEIFHTASGRPATGAALYVGLENADEIVAIGTERRTVSYDADRAARGSVYVPGAVPEGDGPPEPAATGSPARPFTCRSRPPEPVIEPTSVALFEQGLTQIMEASVTGLEPKQAYVVALAKHPDGSGALEPLASFVTSPAGSAIVNALGPIRQQVSSGAADERRYLVVAPSAASGPGKPVQIQRPGEEKQFMPPEFDLDRREFLTAR